MIFGGGLKLIEEDRRKDTSRYGKGDIAKEDMLILDRNEEGAIDLLDQQQLVFF